MENKNMNNKNMENKYINNEDKDILYSTIQLNYFKQGDDMNNCLIKDDNGKVNVKKSLKNYIVKMKSVIDHVKEIHDFIPDENNLELTGDTHYISLNGEHEIIERLVNFNLIQLNTYSDDDESECGENCDINNNNNIENIN